MSRTYFLPVTVDLTGNANDNLPPELVFRDQSASLDPFLPRSIARQYFPYEYDFISEVYNQANQVITELGVIDPVELWERTAETPDKRNAPDDFIATVSVHGPNGDFTGTGGFTVIDATGSPRFPEFELPIGVAAPGRVATRYGIPLFTGDRILARWVNRPVSGDSGFVIVNLTPCDGCELQTAAAAWEQALKDCCGDTCPKGVDLVTSIPSPILTLPGPESYILTITGTGFLIDDVISSVNGDVVITGPPIFGGTTWQVPIDVTTPTPGPQDAIKIESAADAQCFTLAAIFVAPPV